MCLKNICFLFCVLYTCFSFSQNTTDPSTNNPDPSQPTALEKKIYDMNERIANNPQLQVGNINPDSLPSLPIGLVKEINNTIYIVAIDSAVFKNDRAYFNAYMALDFPGANRKLAFQGKNISFNPSGILFNEGVKLALASDALLHLGPKLDLFIKGDGSTYIEFDCNGYKRAHIRGEFRFNGNMLQPVDTSADYVTATVDVFVEDIKNLYASVTFSPFMVKNLEDYKFAVSEASVDMSDFVNPSATLPISFTESLGDQDSPELWRGFYLKNLTVTLPKKVSKKNAQNTQFGVENLFIDDAGVTGIVFGNNVISSTSEGDMAGWGFSIKRIEIGLQSNTLVHGMMKGEIAVKPLDGDTLSYRALISKDHPDSSDVDMSFTISSIDTMVFNLTALKSRLYVLPSSVLSVDDDNPQDKLIPSLILNGLYSIITTKGTVDRIAFQGLHITTQKPYLISGIFSLIPKSGNLGNFPIQIYEIGFFPDPGNSNDIVFSVGVSLNLGEASSQINFTASTLLKIKCESKVNVENSPNLVFKSVSVDQIFIDLYTTPFTLNGVIILKDDDPKFGKLFYGALAFKLNRIMQEPAIFRAGFGRTLATTTTPVIPSYKYWFVDAQIPVNISMGQVALTKLIGGASYHVEPDFSNELLVSKVGLPLEPDALIPFTPNRNFGLGFKAGVGFKHSVREQALNGDAVLGVLFNSSGGFQSINLAGDVYMLVKISERNNPNVANKIHGALNVNYNHESKTFRCDIEGTANFAKAIYADLFINVFIDTNDWYVYFNTPSDRALFQLKRSNGTVLLQAEAYMMFGTIIESIPAFPQQVQNLNLEGGNTLVNNNRAQLDNGGGLAFGAKFSTTIDKQSNNNILGNWYGFVSVSASAGFDLMVLKLSDNAHCDGSSEPVGLNNYYCNGQVYVYGTAAVGARKIKQGAIEDEKSINIAMVVAATGKFPNPTYVQGVAYFEIDIKILPPFSVQGDFAIGENCYIVQ